MMIVGLVKNGHFRLLKEKSVPYFSEKEEEGLCGKMKEGQIPGIDLFGLAMLFIQGLSKEIGLRKELEATVSDFVCLLSNANPMDGLRKE